MGFIMRTKFIYPVILMVIVNIIAWIIYDCHQSRKDDCFTVDQVKFLDTSTVNNEEYVLVLVTTGFQDKVSIIELFKQDVRFDHCGRPDKDYISAIDLNFGPEHGQDNQWPERIEIKDNQIIIHYTKEKEKQKPLVDVPITWHQSKAKSP